MEVEILGGSVPPLREKFPALYALSDSKRARVKAVWETSEEEKEVGILVL